MSYKMPWTSLGLSAAMASMVGIPLFAAFPFRLVLIQSFTEQNGGSILWIFLGLVGLLMGTFRFVGNIFKGEKNSENKLEGRYTSILMICGVVILLLIGIFPKFFLAGANQLLITFQYLKW